MPFRFAAKSVFLTYSQCNASREELLSFLKTIRNTDPTYIIVAQELHDDGNPHLHAVVHWDTRFESRNERIFDYAGFHANIQSPRSTKNCIRYCKKEDVSFIEFGICPHEDQVSNPWSVAVTTSTTEKEFMAAVLELSPRDYVLQHEKLEYFAAKHYRKEVPVYTPTFQQFNVPSEILAWLQDEFSSDKQRKKSLILIGPSKIGKTQWARSLGKHMYFNHLANFKDDWNDDADYIVFDDFDFDFIPNRKGFFGGQECFQISGKYMKVKTVNWGKCCIYCANSNPTIKGDEVDWYNENCTFVNVFNKFY